MSAPIQGPFSYTPPPFINEKPSYPGRRPYKVSKIPKPSNNDGLGDDDISNIVKYMSSQDLEKLLEFVQNKDQGYNKYKDRYNSNEYMRTYKRENKEFSAYEKPTSHKEEIDFLNYVTEPTFDNFLKAQETQYSKPTREHSERIRAANIPNELASFSSEQHYINSDNTASFSIPTKKHNTESIPTYLNIFTAQESQPIQTHISSHYQNKDNTNRPVPDLVFNNSVFLETNEEEKLPPPVNMREEDYESSFTNNVPKVVKPESYDVQNFGDLPLMDYNSKLHDVSSYHVPHYSVTDTKPSQAVASMVSFPSSSSSSSSLLKISPAAAHILEPIYEPAPPVSAAASQTDAHLKATKIWSYKSRGAAYTLNDDGSLTPERSRPREYKRP
ncbi:unnamed protein product [Arctia plantaginis]|uniref:Uncharacterized protein n=1 Tax=Arctia plantaginis TaxID=874455 RepID=A0A8S1AX44_ARCPL|nr:unnamed protein product [Arctia plantaginis]